MSGATGRPAGRAGGVGERGGNEIRFEIAIKQGARAGRKHERGKEILVQAAAADDIEIAVANGLGAHRSQGKLDAIGNSSF